MGLALEARVVCGFSFALVTPNGDSTHPDASAFPWRVRSSVVSVSFAGSELYWFQGVTVVSSRLFALRFGLLRPLGLLGLVRLWRLWGCTAGLEHFSDGMSSTPFFISVMCFTVVTIISFGEFIET